VQRKSSSPGIFVSRESTLCPQKAASFPQIVIVIHGLFTACPQTSVYNLRNIPNAFAGNRPALNRDLGRAAG
jgi:hypothetical protein